MSSQDLVDAVEGLTSTVGHLDKAVADQTENSERLATQLRESNERAARDQRVLRLLVGLVVFKLVTLLVLFFVIVQINSNNDTLRDCIEPTGECAQRNGRQAQAAFLAVERVRLETEIPLAEQRGDTVSVEYRKQRLAQIDAQINAIRTADRIPTQTTTTIQGGLK